jgi:prepilin-type N-terminal cleavage/methylation domain-containing protein
MDSDMRERGFTLIEILVALGVAAMLGLFIFASYSAISVGGLRASDESQMQNTMRVAATLLADDLSRAGFMMNGPSGQNRCARLLVYNGKTAPNVMTSQWPVSAVQQTLSGIVPGTASTQYGYATPGRAQTDAVSIFYAGGFGIGNAAIPGGVRIVKANNGTLNNAALFVADPSSFQVGDVDIVVLPSRNLCIRFQVTGTGGANNIIHNQGGSSAQINPPNGFNGVSSLANPAVNPPISTADLQQAYVQNFGSINGATGPLLVTYSIRPDPNDPATPDLWRTVVNSVGTVVSDNPIAQNVVLLHALFAPPERSDRRLRPLGDDSGQQPARPGRRGAVCPAPAQAQHGQPHQQPLLDPGAR